MTDQLNANVAAAAAVIGTAELLEMILTFLSATDLLRVLQVSKDSRMAIRRSLKPMQMLFLKPETDVLAWLVDTGNATPFWQAFQKDQPELHQHYGIYSRLLRIDRCPDASPTRPTQTHESSYIRHVRLNEQVLSPHGFWKRGFGRFPNAAEPADRLSILTLNNILQIPLHNPRDNSEPERALLVRDRLQADMRTLSRGSNARELERLHEAVVAKDLLPARCYTAPWHIWTYDNIWLQIFIARPPVRKVTLSVEYEGVRTYGDGSIYHGFVRDVGISDGIRLGHIAAAFGPKRRKAVQSTERVEMLLLLHDVVVPEAVRTVTAIGEPGLMAKGTRMSFA